MKNEELVLNVEGMSCQHCVNSIKKAVGVIKGVSNVEVDLDKKTVTTSYDADKVNMEDIKEAIEDQGYEVK
jgi:copper chaperone